MTKINIQGENKVIESQEEVVKYLSEQGVLYEHWNIGKLDESLHDKYVLTESDKEQILSAFKDEIEDISGRRGYQAWDIISLSEETPNLEELLKNFQQEHHHTDDEVRFIVNGHGVFVIQGSDGNFFDVHLNPGDLISVPENIRHYFTLSEDKKVVAVRIFVTREGWVPIY
ncbi:cupin domain-containing protein [Bacillus sp. NTK074B]|uniref:1,2-dihydroxy-3-keto-5-methylthiopentene dioxygenase n=1 Tax=Bacillus sp. NTK074B TaxID=2802174 RepID=UPI001A8EF371|nr:cupin domain-containing protein [Bacillus sp. NTK074B]